MDKEEIVKATILAAARQLIQQYGIQKITMQDIAKSAGKGKSTLYYYFKSKEEILNAVILEDINDMFVRIKAAVAMPDSFKSKLEAYIKSKIEILSDKRQKFKYLIDNDLHHFDFPSYFKEVRFLYDDKETALIVSILEKGVATGEINPEKIKGEKGQHIAEILLTAIRGLEMEVYLLEGQNTLMGKTDLMISLLLEGLH